jgi:ubiquinone/menaquinone biosynthesis C-methylase UbiE
VIPLFDVSNEYVGLDISYTMLKRAAKRMQKKIFWDFTLIEVISEGIPQKSNSFDFVPCDTAIHMIPDYQKALGKFKRF